MGFLNKKAVILVMAVVTVFLLANFAGRNIYRLTFVEKLVTTALSPVEALVARMTYGLQSVTTSTGQLFVVYRDNQALREQIDQLKQNELNVTEIMAENLRLRTMLDYKKSAPQFDFVTAAVIARDPGAWTNIMIINKGSNDGLAKDMPVVTPQGLAGNVVQVFSSTAKVQLILDPRSAVGSLIQRPESRVAAIVEGNSAKPLSPHMVNLSRDADIIRGDKVITSGFGGIYPKGLLVGEVTDIVNEEGGLLKYAVLNPAVDFDRLEEVQVIVRSREPVPVLPNPAAPVNPEQNPGQAVKGTGQ
ncbi:rod shape-determining protein MreC [Anaerospora hongkongensis]|uniref:rod shape-determining protein MreC n=1 Tax=Anaerospora hongkongensis TaxID=244830 RepID=UPI00104FC073|nr:rod shape-determining protein MreC [Anaerospora hongkongensis]